MRWYLAKFQLQLLFALIIFASLSLAQQPAPQEWPDGTSHIQEREQWFYGQRAFPFDRIPPGARLNALKQRQQMQVREQAARAAAGLAAVSTTSWTPLGPQPVSTPFTYGNVSGRIAAIAVDPGNPSVVYIGAAQGGVWKSTNGGTSWSALTDTQPSLAVGSIAIDPNNTNIIYVGTGEQNFAQDSYYGAGILKSIDGGSTWTQLTGTGVGFVPPGSDPTFIGGVAVEPGNSDVVLAAVGLAGNINFGQTGYVARSTDGGSTWTKVLTATGNTAANVVFFDPTNGSVAYAAIQNKGVYRSADGGATWTFLAGTGSNVFPTTNVGRIALAIAPSSPTTLYASVGIPFSTLLGIWKTTDSGANWTKVSGTLQYCPEGQCWYNNAIAVDPANANVVYAGGDINPSTGSTQVYRSTDGGSTWALVPNNNQLHPDLHALTFSADGSILYVGNDGGAWKTTTPTAASFSWTNLNSTLEITQFYANLGIHPTNAQIIFGGTQDNGVESSTATVTWDEVDCGDGSSAAIDYNHTSTVYDNCHGINIFKSTTGGGSGSFTSAQSGITAGERTAFSPPLVIDPVNPSILYFGTFRIYQTTNGASSWTAISPDLTGGDGTFFGNIASIAVAKSNNNVVYVGMNDGKAQVSTNALSGASSTWTNISAGLPGRAVTAIAIDPTNAANVFVTTSGFGTGHVFQSTNSGTTWTNISGNLPNIPVNAIVFDPDIANTLYIGTDVGVMKTSDGGTTWSTLVTGLPNVAVLALGLQESNRLLFAGTHGRGVWELSIPAVALTATTTTVASNANPSVFSQSVTFTATVTKTGGTGTPAGTVTFKDGATTLGTGTLSSGSATLNTSTLTVATHSITAIYGGDSSFSTSTSSPLSQVVSAEATTTTAMSSVNPSVFGQTVTFTATVSAVAPGAGTPTGTVTFKDGATTLGSGALSAGSATFNTSALAAATHAITALYGGDTNYSSSTSASLSQVVNAASTTTTVVSSANPSVFGQSVTFTATVSTVAPGTGTVTGTVTFKDGATTLGSGALSAGSARFNTSALAVGSHSITAVYGGSSNFSGSTSTVATQVVNHGATTTSLVSSLNPSTTGQSVTFTATVSAAAPATGVPSGTVTFKDGVTDLGTGTLSAGAAAVSTAALSAGAHSITAVYGADTNFTASTSALVTQTVNATITSTTTTIASSKNPSVFGQSVIFTATVTPTSGTGTPTGTVTFKDGATTLGTGSLSSGKATFSSSALAVAAHSITAVYGGGSNFSGSTSSTVTQIINMATTTTSAISSANPSVFGQSVVFTATVVAVAPGAGTPTGIVTFKDGASILGTKTLSAGSASLSTATLPVSGHSITVSYGGDADFSVSTSASVTQTVNPASTTSTIVTSLNPTVFGQSVTFTATVTPVAPGAGTANGTVTFKDGTTTLGTGTLSAGSASFSTSGLAVGSHSITAVYGSSTNFASSTSSAITQTVNQAATSANLVSSANPAQSGGTVQFVAMVTAVAPSAGIAGGTVTFKDGATLLGTATLSSGTATFSTPALSVGTHSITAVYGGNTNFAGSTSNAVSQSITAATITITLQASHAPIRPVAIGGTLAETIKVTNLASSTSSTTVTVNISITGNFILSSAAGCTGTGPIMCNAGTLNPGDSTNISLTLTPLLGHDISIHASVGASSADDAISVRFKPQAR